MNGEGFFAVVAVALILVDFLSLLNFLMKSYIHYISSTNNESWKAINLQILLLFRKEEEKKNRQKTKGDGTRKEIEAVER
jgi:hypothetical protein